SWSLPPPTPDYKGVSNKNSELTRRCWPVLFIIIVTPASLLKNAGVDDGAAQKLTSQVCSSSSSLLSPSDGRFHMECRSALSKAEQPHERCHDNRSVAPSGRGAFAWLLDAEAFMSVGLSAASLFNSPLRYLSGINEEAWEAAIASLEKHWDNAYLKRPLIMTLIDFTLPAKSKRLW